MDGFVVSVNDDLLQGTVFECNAFKCDEQTPCSSFCFNNFLASIHTSNLNLRQQLFDANKNCEKLISQVNDQANFRSFLKELTQVCTILQQFNEMSNRSLALYEWAQMVDANARDVWINAQTKEKEHQRVTQYLYAQQFDRFSALTNNF